MFSKTVYIHSQLFTPVLKFKYLHGHGARDIILVCLKLEARQQYLKEKDSMKSVCREAPGFAKSVKYFKYINNILFFPQPARARLSISCTSWLPHCNYSISTSGQKKPQLQNFSLHMQQIIRVTVYDFFYCENPRFGAVILQLIWFQEKCGFPSKEKIK